MSRDFSDIPGKEGDMLIVEYALARWTHPSS